MKERRKVKVEEEQKKLTTFCIWNIRENWNILYKKKRVNVFRLIPIPRECIGKNQKNIVRRRRVKERKVMFKNRKDKKNQ